MKAAFREGGLYRVRHEKRIVELVARTPRSRTLILDHLREDLVFLADF
jgi:hypothetical protein